MSQVDGLVRKSCTACPIKCVNVIIDQWLCRTNS